MNLQTAGGNEVIIDNTGNSVTINDDSGNNAVMSGGAEPSLILTDAGGNTVAIGAGADPGIYISRIPDGVSCAIYPDFISMGSGEAGQIRVSSAEASISISGAPGGGGASIAPSGLAIDYSTGTVWLAGG